AVFFLALATTPAWRAAQAQEPDSTRAQELDTQPALDAAEAWLALVDGGRYDESWESAAPNFQEAVTRLKWVVMVDEARNKMGILVKRKLRAARSAVDLPNSPRGDYV